MGKSAIFGPKRPNHKSWRALPGERYCGPSPSMLQLHERCSLYFVSAAAVLRDSLSIPRIWCVCETVVREFWLGYQPELR